MKQIGEYRKHLERVIAERIAESEAAKRLHMLCPLCSAPGCLVFSPALLDEIHCLACEKSIPVAELDRRVEAWTLLLNMIASSREIVGDRINPQGLLVPPARVEPAPIPGGPQEADLEGND